MGDDGRRVVDDDRRRVMDDDRRVQGVVACVYILGIWGWAFVRVRVVRLGQGLGLGFERQVVAQGAAQVGAAKEGAGVPGGGHRISPLYLPSRGLMKCCSLRWRLQGLLCKAS